MTKYRTHRWQFWRKRKSMAVLLREGFEQYERDLAEISGVSEYMRGPSPL